MSSDNRHLARFLAERHRLAPPRPRIGLDDRILGWVALQASALAILALLRASEALLHLAVRLLARGLLSRRAARSMLSASHRLQRASFRILRHRMRAGVEHGLLQ